MTNVPTIGDFILFFVIQGLLSFTIAFSIYYQKFENFKRATITGIFSIVIFIILAYFMNLGYVLSTIAPGILVAVIGIFAYPPPFGLSDYCKNITNILF